MNTTTAASLVGVDLAKNVFELAVADGGWRITERARLSRAQFQRWFQNRQVGLVVMEACGSAHHWARWLAGLGITVKLLPARYVRAYVKRNKTDAADAAALLEAARNTEIVPVRVKSLEQQGLQALHRTRSLWMATRTSRINALRGFCREFGIGIAEGSRVGVEQIGRVLADPQTAIPGLLRGTMTLLVEEIRLLEARISQLERELTNAAKQSSACATLLSVPGIGLLTATATPSTPCASGPWASSDARTTTRPSARWRTSWRGSATPRCGTRSPTARRDSVGRSSASPSRCRLKTTTHHRLHGRVVAHHGQPGSPHTARRRQLFRQLQACRLQRLAPR